MTTRDLTTACIRGMLDRDSDTVTAALRPIRLDADQLFTLTLDALAIAAGLIQAIRDMEDGLPVEEIFEILKDTEVLD